jgi:DNA-binding phage protein
MAKHLTPKQWHAELSKEAHYEAFDDLCEHIRKQVNSINGPSIDEVATVCEVSSQTIRNWLYYAVMFPHFKTICKVARGMGFQVRFVRPRAAHRRLRSAA